MLQGVSAYITLNFFLLGVWANFSGRSEVKAHISMKGLGLLVKIQVNYHL